MRTIAGLMINSDQLLRKLEAVWAHFYPDFLHGSIVRECSAEST